MQNLNQILAQPAFQPIIKKSKQIHQFNQIFKKLLATQLLVIDNAAQCHVVDLDPERGCLFLSVASGAFATRLRYETPQLLKVLQTHQVFAGVQSIHWQVQLPIYSNPALSQKREMVKSDGTAELLLTTSQHIKNQNLKNSLEKLAHHLSI